MTKHLSFPPDETPADSHRSTSDYLHRPDQVIPGRKVYIIGGGANYVNWTQSEIVHRMEDATYCCLTGGEDCWPGLYGAKAHFSTYFNHARDDYEVAEAKKAFKLGLPILGICRGSQLGVVLSGGKLVQDQEPQPGRHPMTTSDGRTITVTSSHHQAQWPWNLPPGDFKVLGWTKGLSSYHWGEEDGDEMVLGRAPGDIEIEIAAYRKTRILAVQSHPEWSWHDYDTSASAKQYIDYVRSLLDAHLDGTL